MEKKVTQELINQILALGVRDMPTNPSAQGYSETQVKAFFYKPEEKILLILSNVEEEFINEIESILKKMDELKVDTDKTLSLSDEPADAKVVGEKFNEIFNGFATTEDIDGLFAEEYTDILEDNY